MNQNHVVPLHVDGWGFRRSAAVVKHVETNAQAVDCAWPFLTVSGIGEIAKKERHSVRASAAADVELERRVKAANRCASVEIVDDSSSLLAARRIGQFQHAAV